MVSILATYKIIKFCNMKKIILFIALACLTSIAFAQEFSDIVLPDPQKGGGKPLMEALNNRQTIREFDTIDLDLQQISNLLWAANGINRPDEQKRTAPTAMNNQEIDVYVSIESGVYLYDAITHSLKAITQGDFRKEMGRQNFVANAPVVLVYVADFGKMSLALDKKTKTFYTAIDVGFISQNVYLFAASENLATVVLGWISKNQIAKILNLKKNQHVLLSQPIGNIK
jgi:SagB-type dehydrogenase family enzyme